MVAEVKATVGRGDDNDGSRAKREPAPVRSRESRTVQKNVEAIKSWERSLMADRSAVERIGDWITGVAASGPVLLVHVVWFTAWIAANLGLVTGVAPFDPFPFPFLTMVVSLEAIFLALFVLAGQNRLSRQSDKRAHLDLQIDLLAEREMTAVLQLLQDIASHLKVPETVTADEIRDLTIETDVRGLTRRMDELEDAGQEVAS